MTDADDGKLPDEVEYEIRRIEAETGAPVGALTFHRRIAHLAMAWAAREIDEWSLDDFLGTRLKRYHDAHKRRAR
jgi:hypothetical protein